MDETNSIYVCDGNAWIGIILIHFITSSRRGQISWHYITVEYTTNTDISSLRTSRDVVWLRHWIFHNTHTHTSTHQWPSEIPLCVQRTSAFFHRWAYCLTTQRAWHDYVWTVCALLLGIVAPYIASSLCGVSARIHSIQREREQSSDRSIVCVCNRVAQSAHMLAQSACLGARCCVNATGRGHKVVGGKV